MVSEPAESAQCRELTPHCSHSVTSSFLTLHICLQYLAEAGWAAEGRVVGVTQPRRVAAVSVSFSMSLFSPFNLIITSSLLAGMVLACAPE